MDSGWADPRRGHRGGSRAVAHRRGGRRVPAAEERGRRLTQGTVPVPRREDTLLQRDACARTLLLFLVCARAATSIKFVQKIDGLSFVEAVERLAARAGVDLRYEQGGYVPGQEQSQRRRLIDAHRAAAEFYAERLGGSDAAPARAFLAERGFELADIQRFGVGYSPKAWEDLTRHLRGRGFTDSELIAAGLSREGNRGTRDRFRGAADVAHPRPVRRRHRVRRPQARPRGRRAQVPEHAGDLAVPQEHRAVRGGPGQARDRAAQAGGHRRGLHRRDGLPPGRGADRGGHLRHLVRRGPHQGAAPADHGLGRVHRRGDLHLRRRRGRPAGRAARVRHGGEVRHPDVRDRASRTASTRATCGWRTATGPCATWSPAGSRCSSSPSRACSATTT